ncbi:MULTISPECIES: DUF3696 domain-containing protein [Marinobacter]|uniref:DUF3696 domain-containing protein n=1 Tax=Marinobacter TaxID=2742 RepID=UPI001246990D|nr:MULTISPECIES: DUF3696 domain-containing protein [Marinobacter]MBL3554760.1 DUF3696 domain-containing protein [Marinobacter sp. JB05H06]
MRITQLTLANFRSFRKEQTIEFAPLTLLFGPNSVGKSTVLMALFYVQQILAKGQCDPQRIEAMGGRFVGGFRHLVHGKRLDETLRIGVEFELGEKLGSSYVEVGDLVAIEIGPIGELIGLAARANKMSVGLEVSWSPDQERAYVSRYTVAFDGEELAEITSDSGLKQPMITGINYQHSLLKYDELTEWVSEQIEQGQAVHPSLVEYILDSKDEEGPDLKDLAYSDEALQSELHELTQIQPLISESVESNADIAESSVMYGSFKALGIKGFAGALPTLGRTLVTSLSLSEDMETRVVEEILSDIFVAPLDNLLELLNESLCIGPLRHIRDATYHSNAYPAQGDWYSGKACWDVLAAKDPERDSLINHWISDADKLNLGYQLVYKMSEEKAKFVAPRKVGALEQLHELTSRFYDGSLERELAEKIGKDLDEPTKTKMGVLLEKFRETGYVIKKTDPDFGETSSQTASLTLWDTLNEIEVAPSDIGVGVSQLFPLVVASFITKSGFVSCEQPELHVHPRIQVAIGDMLLHATEKNSFLIETHSEHLVLRLLRRIRETTENRLPEDIPPVRPEDISIVYLEPGEDGVSVRRIQIDEDGEFTSRWPQGFFSERREELL